MYMWNASLLAELLWIALLRYTYIDIDIRSSYSLLEGSSTISQGQMNPACPIPAKLTEGQLAAHSVH